MVNFRVEGLDELHDALRRSGITILEKAEDYDYGRFRLPKMQAYWEQRVSHPTIYHFCNDSFGAAFALRSIAFAKRRRFPLVIVRAAQQAPTMRSRLRRIARTGVERLGNTRIRHLWLENVNDPRFANRIRPSDHGIVTGFNQILDPKLIARFRSLVNVHPSLLPYYRGPEPTAWCIFNGEIATGFTIHEITARIDEGPILYQEVVPIRKNDDAAALAHAIAERAVVTYERYLECLFSSAPWPRVTVDASKIYRNPVGYRSALS
jgi:Formyl transferase